MGLVIRTFLIKYPHQGFTEGSVLEVIWTLIPVMVSIEIAFSSLKLYSGRLQYTILLQSTTFRPI